jgi:ABC-type transporter MlaC component
MEHKPLRADPAATDVTVRTEVIRSGQAPVQIDYGDQDPSGMEGST